jgi:pre-mRNA-processing factor SLU7
VFGSYWRDGQWGYACCHSLIRQSYCTGEAGRSINDETTIEEAIRQREAQEELSKAIAKQRSEAQKTLVELHQEKLKAEAEKQQKKKEKRKAKKKRKNSSKKKASSSSSSDSSSSSSSSSSESESDSEDEEKKKKKELKKALAEEERRQNAGEDLLDDRKRSYNSRYDVKAPTEAEMEAFYMKRVREEDPMLDFISKKKKK